MKKVFRFLGALTVLVLFPLATVNATQILEFSDYSSDDTPASVLTASVGFTVSGTQLLLDITNTSDFLIAGIYFNSDVDLTGLEFAGTNLAWSISGTGNSQDKGADGFGSYNWLIDFGSGADRLSSGLTQLTLNMTGTTSEDTFGSKLSTNPPGNIRAFAAMKFEAGPGDDSAYGASIPDPAAVFLLGSACLIGFAGARRKTRKKLPIQMKQNKSVWEEIKE